MPADGISLPPKRDFGTSRWGGSKVRLHQRRHRAEGVMTACGTFLPCQPRRAMSASLIGHSGSSAFQTIHPYSVDVAHGLVLLFGIGTKGPFHHGIRGRGGTIFRAALPSDER